MQQWQAVVNILDFTAPMFVFVNLVYVQILPAPGEKRFGSFQQGMGAEIDIIGHDIEGLVLFAT